MSCLKFAIFFVTVEQVLILSLGAATIWVPDDYTSIQMAINHAQNGDTVMVKPGVYQERIDFSGKDIIVMSRDGAAVTTIDAQGLGTAVMIYSGEPQTTIFQGFTVINGEGHPSCCRGGGIAILGAAAQVRDNIIQDCHSAFGGGMSIMDLSGSPATALISGNTFVNNQAENLGGGIFTSKSSPTIENNIFTGNSAQGDVVADGNGPGGGGFYAVFSVVTLRGNTFEDNLATHAGGGVFLIESSGLLENNNIRLNQSRHGAGLHVEATSGLVTVSSTVFSENVGANLYPGDESKPLGGAMGVFGSEILIDNCDFLQNSVQGVNCSTTGAKCGYGGAIDIVNSNATITNSLFDGNDGEFGGAIWSSLSTVTFSGNTVQNNSAQGAPAFGSYESTSVDLMGNTISANFLAADTPTSGIAMGTVSFQRTPGTMSGNTIQGNHAQFGGGVSIQGSSSIVTLSDNTISGNEGLIISGGVCVNSNSSATLLRNKIVSNYVSDSASADTAGGVDVTGSASLTMINNLVCNNQGQFTGGIAILGGSVSNIINNTIVSNSPHPSKTTGGGGIFVHQNAVTAVVKNNIIAFNNKYQVYEHVMNASFINNLMDSSGSGMYFNPNSGLINDPAVLDASPLVDANNTLNDDPYFLSADLCEYRLHVDSVCVDSGNETDAPNDDIDGTNRYLGNGTDIGAFEVCIQQQDGSISGVVWKDANVNSIFDPGEGVSGITINLFADSDCDGSPDGPVLDTQVSNAGGQYLFSNVLVGQPAIPECYVAQVDQTGLGACVTAITPISLTQELACITYQSSDQNFGFQDTDYQLFMDQWPQPITILDLIQMICN